MAYSIAFHVLAAVIWVGGMFFAYHALRPAAASLLEPPQRLTLWVGVFQRFFLWVWLAIATLLISGYWMMFQYFGGLLAAPMHIQIMHAGAWLMIAIYLYVFFAPFRALRQAVAIRSWQAAGAELNKIRKMVALNTTLGLFIIIVASAGRYL